MEFLSIFFSKIIDLVLPLFKKGKDVEKAAKSIDDFGRLLMHKFGKNPEGKRHFNAKEMSLGQKTSVQKLVDLGILRYESESKEYGFDSAYHWTKFGDKVMKYLGIMK